MKKIENKTVEIVIRGNAVKKRYSDLLTECVNNAPEQGMKLKEIQKRLKLLDILEATTDELSFEIDDLTRIKKLVDDMTFGVVSKGIVQFIEDIEAM